MRISIFGLGYVGTVSLGCLARDGHEVVGVDVDPNKLELLRQGNSPVIEAGMQELVASAMHNGRTRVTNDGAEAVANTDLSFVCVGTPSLRSGEHDLRALVRVSEAIGAAVARKDSHHVVVIRSTIAPGTTAKVIVPAIESTAGCREGEGFSVCFQPEFLREGSSIADYDLPPMTVVGGSPLAVAAVREAFGHLPCEFAETDLESAEMLKFCCNAFHALKITFANEVGRLSQARGVDGRRVMDLLCKDERLNISRAYLRPGFAFGGSCLPKDLRALSRMAVDTGVQVPMLSSVLDSNGAHLDHGLALVLQHDTRKVGMIGLSFKAGTDDLRESPLLELAERLLGKGRQLRIYDPEVNVARLTGSNKAFVEGVIPHLAELVTGDVADVLADIDVLVVGQNAPETRAAVARWAQQPGKVVVDLSSVDWFDDTAATYSGICW